MTSNSQVPPLTDGGNEPSAPVPPKKRRRKRRYVLLAILLLLAVGEVSLRIFADHNSKFNIRVGAGKEFDPYRRERWKKDYHHGEINTNSKGFPCHEFDDRKPAGSYRIITLGDSCSVLPMFRSYPVVLEEKLRQIMPNRPIEVINASCPGYDSGQARIWYEREIDGYEHDMLIIYLGWNDMGQYNPDGLADKLQSTGYLNSPSLLQRAMLSCYLLRSLYLFTSISGLQGNASLEALTSGEAATYTNFYPAHFERNLTAIIELARSHGRKVYLVNYAGLVRENPTADEQQRIHFPRGMGKKLKKYVLLLQSYVSALTKVAQATQTPVIDIASLFNDPEQRRCFTDSCHFNAQGAERIAGCVAETIQPDIR